MILLFWRRRQYTYDPAGYGRSLLSVDGTPSTTASEGGTAGRALALQDVLGGTSGARAPMMGETGLLTPVTRTQMEDR